MNIRLKGSNYAVSKVMNKVEQYLRYREIMYNLVCAGGHYTQSKADILIVIDGSPLDIMAQLEDSNVCIEVVEETPGAIFTYLSEKGSTSFTRSCQDIEVDCTYDDFEDEERYCERMREIGVMI